MGLVTSFAKPQRGKRRVTRTNGRMSWAGTTLEEFAAPSVEVWVGSASVTLSTVKGPRGLEVAVSLP
jgi:hypothetical protein